MKNHIAGSTATQLVRAIAELEAALGRESILQAIANAAYRMQNCNGVALLSSRGTDCEFVPVHNVASELTSSYALRLCRSAQWPQRGGVKLVVDAAKRAGDEPAALLVGVRPSAGCEAMGFIWSRISQRKLGAVQTLRALAFAASLALRLERDGDDLRRSRENLRLHVEDLQHRLRNVLAFVRSIVRRTLQSADSSEEFALHLEGRIGALSRTHSSLNAAGAVGVEIQDLVRTELIANAVRESQFQILGPSVRLRARAAETIAMALHELATNSLKFGALAAARGYTRISWWMDTAGGVAWLHFQWLESGVRIVAPAPRRRGFGQELIEQTLPYELGARTRFELTPGGLLCVVYLPLNARTANSILPEQRTARSAANDGFPRSASR